MIVFLVMSRNKKYKNSRLKFENVAQSTDALCKKLYSLEADNCQDFDLCANVMGDGTRAAVRKIKYRRNRKKNECTCSK